MPTADEIMQRLGWRPIRARHRHDPSEAELDDFERQIGGSLPADYRRFLQRYGQGGFDRGARFAIREACPYGRLATLDRVYGFPDEAGQGVVDKTMSVYAGRIPDETIPIGEDPGGNLVVLGFRGEARNHVWFWDHQHVELAGRLEQMEQELKAAGVDTSQLNDEAMIHHWELLHPGKLGKPAGYNSLYAVADSFTGFIDSLQPHPDYDR